MKHIAVIGASGGIGRAFIDQLFLRDNEITLYAFSRSEVDFKDQRIVSRHIDIVDEASVKNAAEGITGQLDMLIVATGVLHDDGMSPEKSIRDLSYDNMAKSYAVNAIGPTLVGKYFLPLMKKDERAVFAAISARVGSISDNNKVGGWYAYRASKAALNMVIKNFSIEMKRKYKELIIVALQPGTVDTQLSKPFQGHVAKEQLFSPEFSAGSLLDAMEQLSPEDSGKLFDWSGKEIDP